MLCFRRVLEKSITKSTSALVQVLTENPRKQTLANKSGLPDPGHN